MSLAILRRLCLLPLGALLLCATHPARPDSRPPRVERYLDQYRYLAVELNEHTEIPVAITLAVAGLESAWGRSELAVQANNHFGIKVKDDWYGNAYCKNTQEHYEAYSPVEVYDCFRKYPLIRRSYEDFGRFISLRPNYRTLRAYPSWSLRSWAEGLQMAGYATDPDYADKLMGLIWRYRLHELE